MEKLTKEQIETINKNFIQKETEKAYLLKMSVVRLDGETNYTNIWVPKSCTEITECGLLIIKKWFLKNKREETHLCLTQVFEY